MPVRVNPIMLQKASHPPTNSAWCFSSECLSVCFIISVHINGFVNRYDKCSMCVRTCVHVCVGGNNLFEPQ